MTITSKDLSGPEAHTGVARDEHEKKLKELQELQARIDKLKPVIGGPHDPVDEHDFKKKSIFKKRGERDGKYTYKHSCYNVRIDALVAP